MSYWHDIQIKKGRFSDENRAVIIMQGDNDDYNELRLEIRNGDYHLRERWGEVDDKAALEYFMKEKDVDVVYNNEDEEIATMDTEIHL